MSNLVMTLLVGGYLLLIDFCLGTCFTNGVTWQICNPLIQSQYIVGERGHIKVWVCPEKLDSAFQTVTLSKFCFFRRFCVQNFGQRIFKASLAVSCLLVQKNIRMCLMYPLRDV